MVPVEKRSGARRAKNGAAEGVDAIAYITASSELAEQIEKLLRDVFANRLLVGVAQRIRNVRVSAASIAFTRSRCLALASGCFGCLVRRQTDRPPLYVIVQTHCGSVALKTAPRKGLSLSLLYKKVQRIEVSSF